jgi:transglutaminase-like putative cysteine protease
MKHCRLRLWATGLGLVLTLFSHVAFARWATIDDAPAISRLDEERIDVAKDGTYRSIRETLIEIRNEEGRTAFGLTSLKYNAQTTRLRVLTAETRHPNGTVYAVPAELMEDKPLASSAEGFDETRQISIAFPHVEIGSKLYLKYEERVSEVPFKGAFSTKLFVGAEIPEEHSKSIISSAIPLLIEKNDPQDALRVEQKNDGREQVTTVILTKPLYVRTIDEDDSYLNPSDSTWIVLSSHADYGFLGNLYATTYENVLAAPLPPAFETILEKAKKQKGFVNQLNSVTSQLAEQVRYLGDWRSTNGGHIPRPLDKIANTKFGDCKDFSVVTAALARRLGYPSEVAWIERALRPTPLPKLSLDSAFNHAIVLVHEGERVHWIDPTNFASFAQGVFDDISGRPALVISSKGSHLANVPPPTATDSMVSRRLEIEFGANGDALINAQLGYLGRSANILTGIGRELSKDSVTHIISQALSDNNLVRWSKVDDYELTSRITKDTNLTARLSVQSLSLRATAGFSYQLGWEDMGKLINLDVEHRISDLFLGPPERLEASYRLENIQVIGKLPDPCVVDSRWVAVSRRLEDRKGEVWVTHTRDIKRIAVKATDFKTKEFSAFQEKLRQCFLPLAVVYKLK